MDHNVYICPNLHAIGTTFRDQGTTPMFMNCAVCKEMGRSTFGKIVPDKIHGTWINPTPEELEEIIQYDCSTHEVRPDILRSMYREHINKGGVVLKWDSEQVAQLVSDSPDNAISYLDTHGVDFAPFEHEGRKEIRAKLQGGKMRGRNK